VAGDRERHLTFVRQELMRQLVGKHNAQLTNLDTAGKWTQPNFWNLRKMKSKTGQL